MNISSVPRAGGDGIAALEMTEVDCEVDLPSGRNTGNDFQKTNNCVDIYSIISTIFLCLWLKIKESVALGSLKEKTINIHLKQSGYTCINIFKRYP